MLSLLLVDAAVAAVVDGVPPDVDVVAALDPGWVQTDMGGPRATLTVSEAVSALIKAMASISETCRSGMLGVKGIVPW